MTHHDPMRQLRHDIKGCLNSLFLSAEVLTDEMEPAEAADFLDGLERAAEKMIVLIDKLPYRDEDEEGQ